MATYLIGDVQGCDAALERLLNEVGFSPSRDKVYLLGDLVNRGPASAQVLRRCMRMEGSLLAILGNHDLHLLGTAAGVRKGSRRDTLDRVLQAPDAQQMLEWLRHQPLARLVEGFGAPLLLVHAGLLPDWTAQQALSLAAEVEAVLADAQASQAFISVMYGNKPAKWSPDLRGADRLRVIVNALTRLRFCTSRGRMDFDCSDHPDQAPADLVPWFEVTPRASADTLIAFGHWSTLGLLNRPNLLALDTGCVWGGCLTAVRLGPTLADREFIQVSCEAAQTPG
ncbi:biotin transporter BioY [Lampropedia cohaerens]|uniref:Bis(5'-nucleosyl)-tetraphosphatase, symmetrical n=1 Tax=Lampropedia cohaerens TaxID=1610491 RepID=A0A0U1Q3G5_9BURK|nr:symmetrical bis(5'-nucleosyl)-tetraphosphatase [Lampropedia cohaerens]KKW69286.1 biotin transporter BioY [Lampropedia cohaerens]